MTVESEGQPWAVNLRQELRPQQLLPNLTVSLLVSAIGITISISFAALIFSGELSGYVSVGIGIALFSAVIFRTVIALFSSFPSAIADTDERPAAILALVAAAILQNMPPTASPSEKLVTVLATIALTSLLTGVLLLLLGLFKAGDLIRFVPFPVMGGFIAGTGWLLVSGAMQVMLNQPLSPTSLPDLLQPSIALRWLPGLGLALLLVVLSRRFDSAFLLPLSLLGGIAVFYAVLFLSQTSIAEASAQGWLLGPFPQGGLWHLPNYRSLLQIDWSPILHQIGSISGIAVIAATSILLTANGLELISGRDIDLNRELRLAGVANVLSGLGGGLVGCHVFPDSVLAYRMGGRSRLVGLTTALICLIVLQFGSSALSLFPKPIAGGILLFLGLSFLLEWLYDGWFKLARSDYFIILLILLVIAAVGFLEGLAVGLFLAVVLFVVSYSRISIAKHVLTGASYQSHVARPQHQLRLLQERGDRLYILELQGFIFFGTANRLLKQIRQRLQEATEPLQFVILDFRLVSGVDSSAVLSFARLKQLAQKQSFVLVLTHLSPEIDDQLQRGNVFKSEDPACRLFPDLDRGVEWCEGQILESTSWKRSRFLPLPLQLRRMFADSELVADFMPYLEKRSLSTGEILFHQGSESDCLYFIESGQITTFVESGAGQTLRLQTSGAGMVVGEIAFHTRSPHRTAALAEQSTIVYSLSRASLQRMQQAHPSAAIVFQKYMIALLSERLGQAYREVKGLMT